MVWNMRKLDQSKFEELEMEKILGLCHAMASEDHGVK